MSEPFERITFVRDESQQLQAVTAYCNKCEQERAPVVVPLAWGTVRVRCPICQATATLIVAEHDDSLAPWS